MIEIKNLTKKFPNVIAVNNLSLNVDKGINGLIGENGAGKSTLLRLIADVYQKDGGEILIDGKPNSDKDSRTNVFFLCDDPYHSSNGNAISTLDFYESLFDLDKEVFKRMMSKLSLPLDRRIGTFSKGMRRQLFLCIALSMKANYILLDEAFDGLDPIVQDVIKEEIIKSSSEKTFIVSSHNLQSLERLCDNFILLSKGRLGKEGAQEDLGQSFTKYQMILDKDVTKEELEALGISTISIKKVGSITMLVTTSKDAEQIIKDNYNPRLLESIMIDNDEVIKLEMLLAKERMEDK